MSLQWKNPKYPYGDQIRKRISKILNAGIEQISIKATTTEKLGFVGRTEGVVSFATVLLMKKDLNV